MCLQGAENFSKLVYKAKKIYDAHRQDLEKERTENEFIAVCEQYEASDDPEGEYLDTEEETMAPVTSYVNDRLGSFAKIVK